MEWWRPRNEKKNKKRNKNENLHRLGCFLMTLLTVFSSLDIEKGWPLTFAMLVSHMIQGGREKKSLFSVTLFYLFLHIICFFLFSLLFLCARHRSGFLPIWDPPLDFLSILNWISKVKLLLFHFKNSLFSNDLAIT
jgi:hypothetical protein